MSSTSRNQYNPDYVSPPGETLLEVLEERGMSQAELAKRTGRPRKTISEIINCYHDRHSFTARENIRSSGSFLESAGTELPGLSG
jgi:plasmid maintenance system antidote protein VapI